MDKLHIQNEMRQFDLKNRKFYDELSAEEQKKFSTYLMLKYGASVDGAPDLQEWYLRATNERLNKNFFDLNKHEKLQWLLCTTVSPGMGVHRHYWQPSKRKEGDNKLYKFLSKLYPEMKISDIELLVTLIDKKEIRELAQEMGYSDSDIKRALG